MNGSRWTVLVLVVGALALSLVYGLQPKSHAKTAVSASVASLQAAAALEPCPHGLGSAFPTQTFDCLGGGNDVYAASTGTGKPTLVNVYGSWCGPCKLEMPILRQFHDAAGAQVPLVGIDSEDDLSSALRFAKDVRQDWPALYDNDKEVATHFHLPGTPATLFLDSSGKVTFVQLGAFKSLAQMKALVKQHLGVAV